jgi:hypothetical protein
LSRNYGADISSEELVENTRGAIFLGTPFEGSEKAAWGSTALRIASYFSSTKKEDIKDLEERSAKLLGINQEFLAFIKARDRGIPIEIACIFEALSIKLLGQKLLIVTKHSAVLPGVRGQSIEANHVDMCKFEDEERNGFRSIPRSYSSGLTQ